MPTDRAAPISSLNDALTEPRYSPVLAHNYCSDADQFRRYLHGCGMAPESVTPADVAD